VRANVYVDGINLYYGALQGTPYKWLDLRRLSQLLLPGDRIHRIRYFTARVQTPRDQTRAQRQQTYIRALETLPRLSVHYASARSDRLRLPVGGPGRPDELVSVTRTSVKGADVHLAALLLADGFRGDYEVAVVVSNDSDLVPALRIVRNQLRLPVGLLLPLPRQYYAVELRRAATFSKPIRAGVLAASQFPPQLTDANGTITKPSAW
jgi:uncharacterized LabA/DUF88 family protein